MTRLHPLLAALPIVLVACQGAEQSGDATVFAEDAVSLVPPDGWEVKHQKDTLVFVGGAADDDTRPVIAVRHVPVESWSERRTLEGVLPSVKTVLEALPGATVEGPRQVEHPAYRARAFDVVFTPRSRRGKRYQRRHVVLEAHGHLYHAFLTAPEGQLEENLPTFERVVSSLREEA